MRTIRPRYLGEPPQLVIKEKSMGTVNPCPVEYTPGLGIGTLRSPMEAAIVLSQKKKILTKLPHETVHPRVMTEGTFKAVIFKYKSLVFHHPICRRHQGQEQKLCSDRVLFQTDLKVRKS